MEIEAKFRVDNPGIFSQLMALPGIEHFALEPVLDSEQQQNTYYDTDDGRLRAAKYGLRTRQVGQRSVVTLKGPGQVHEGVHRRAEWEFAADNPDPARWPAGEARTLIQNLIGDAALLPILTIATNRRHIMARRDGTTIAELSLDDSTISAAGQTRAIRELEIELLAAGTQDDFDALVAALRTHFSLVPEAQSKLERGLALLDGNQ